jgi:hypothetical protein
MKLLIRYYYLIPLLLSAIVSLRAFRLAWPKPYKLFSMYLWVYFLIELFAYWWKTDLYKTAYWDCPRCNTWIYNIAYLFIHWALLELFGFLLVNKRIRTIIRYWKYIFIPLAGVYTIVFFKFDVLSPAATVIHLVHVVLAMIFFFQLLRQEQLIKLTTAAPVWITLGILIYYSTASIFVTALNALVEELKMTEALDQSMINKIFLSIMFILFIVGFRCKPISENE